MSLEKLTNNGDGTVTDSVTSLMWTATTFKRIHNGQLYETGNGFTWEEANKLFGKGRKIPAENAPKEISPKTHDGYKSGTASQVSVLGFNDWRLPTVEELRSLTDSYGDYRYDDEIVKIFEASFQESVWAANYAGFVANRYDGAWAFFEGLGVCEMPLVEKYSVRLVRGGTVFNSFERTKSGGSCFIATAAYGDYDAPEVVFLRAFRDESLSQGIWGRGFIKVYYLFSPSVAKIIAESESLRGIARKCILQPLIWLLRYFSENQRGEHNL